MLFDEIFWSDGQIRKFTVLADEQDTPSYGIRIEADVYKSSESPDRMRVSMHFSEVHSVITACNTIEMKENFSYGNINNGYSKGKLNYILYLVDGYIEISAEKIEIEVL